MTIGLGSHASLYLLPETAGISSQAATRASCVKRQHGAEYYVTAQRVNTEEASNTGRMQVSAYSQPTKDDNVLWLRYTQPQFTILCHVYCHTVSSTLVHPLFGAF